MCDAEIHWCVRRWFNHDDGSRCEAYEDSDAMTRIGKVMGILDGQVLEGVAAALQVWEMTTHDNTWRPWSDEPIEIGGELKLKTVRRTLEWLTRMEPLSDEEIIEVAHSLYGTSLEGVEV